MLNKFNLRFALPMMLALIFGVLVLSGCKKQKTVAIVDEPDPDIVVQRPESLVPKWLPGDYPHVAVILGAGYETEETSAPVMNYLSYEFGLAEDGGLIETYFFPEEYLNGKRIKVSFLTDTLKDKNIIGLVLLSAPDRTYYALMDLVESGISYPVWSVFPVTYNTDEILGTECGSFFVLDYKEYVNGESTEPEDSMLLDDLVNGSKNYKGNVGDILTPVIHYIKKTADVVNNPYSPSDAAEYLLKEYKEIFSNCTLNRFIEPESSLPALNHYVLGIYK